MAQEQQQLPDWLTGVDDHQQEMTLVDFYRVIPYQKRLFFGIFLATVLLGTIIIFMLPKAYQSSASILMERESTFSVTNTSPQPESLNLRMRAILATLLSSNSVSQLLEELGMITPSMDDEQRRARINAFKNNVNFEFDNIRFISERSGTERSFSMGFNISYQNRSPELALVGTEALVNRLLNYSSERVAQRAATQTEFLRKQLAEAEQQLARADAELTAFKEENVLSLPDMRGVSISRMNRMEQQIMNYDNRIALLHAKLDGVRSQISSIESDSAIFLTTGERVSSPEDQLLLLEIEYSSLRNKYSADHPDRLRLEEEIAALKQHLNEGGSNDGVKSELRIAEQKLSELLERYSPKHPDVAAQQARVAELREEIAAGNLQQNQLKSASSNPVYTRLLSDKKAYEVEISLARQKQRELRNELEGIERILQKLPAGEQGLRRLEDARNNAEEHYQELQTELSETLENLNKRDANLSETFLVTEAPVLPTAPSKPNKKLLFAVLGLLSLGLAYAVVFIRHMVKDTILHSSDVEKVTKLPVFLIPEFQ